MDFRDLFKSHDIDRIPPIKKMQYLKDCLTGEAAGYCENQWHQWLFLGLSSISEVL